MISWLSWQHNTRISLLPFSLPLFLRSFARSSTSFLPTLLFSNFLFSSFIILYLNSPLSSTLSPFLACIPTPLFSLSLSFSFYPPLPYSSFSHSLFHLISFLFLFLFFCQDFSHVCPSFDLQRVNSLELSMLEALKYLIRVSAGVSIRVFIRLSVCVCVDMAIYPCVYVSIWPYIRVYVSIWPYIRVYVSIWPYIRVYVLSTNHGWCLFDCIWIFICLWTPFTSHMGGCLSLAPCSHSLVCLRYVCLYGRIEFQITYFGQHFFLVI